MIGYKTTSPAGIEWVIDSQVDDKWFAVSSIGKYVLITTIDSLDLLVSAGFGDPVPDDELSELIGGEI